MADIQPFISPPNLTEPSAYSLRYSAANPEIWSSGYQAQAQASQQQENVTNQVLSNYSMQQNTQNQQSVDPVYAAAAKANAQLEVQQVLQSAKANVQPGGNLGSDIGNAYDGIAQKYIQGAPNPITAQHLATSFIGARGSAVRWGNTQQLAYNNVGYLNKFKQSAQGMSIIAQQNPEQVDTLNGQLQDYADGLKQANVPAVMVDKELGVAQTALTRTGLLSTADKNPAQILKQLNDGSITNNVDAQFLSKLQNRAQTALNTQIGLVTKGMDDVRSTVLNGVGVPPDAGNRLDLADKMTAFLQDSGNLVPKQQEALLSKRAEVGSLLQIANELKGKTPEQLQGLQLQAATAMANNPGDQSVVNVKKDMNTLIETRLKAIKDNPYQVEITDGTMPHPAIPLSSDLNKNPQALQEFTQERTVAAASLQAKYGNGALPFTDSEITSLKNTMKNLAPSQKLQQLQFLNQLGPQTLGAISGKLAKDEGGSAFPMAVGLSAYDSDTALKIAKGMEYLQGKDGTKLASQLSTKDTSGAVSTTFNGLFDNDPKTIKSFSQAAQSAAAYDHITQGKDLKQAYQDELAKISGVQSVSRGFFSGNYNTITPYTKTIDDSGKTNYQRMNGSDFNKTISNLKPGDMETYGNGKPIFALDNKTIDPSSGNLTQYKWIPVQDGVYKLVNNVGKQETSAVRDSDGAPYLFDMNHYLKDLKG